MTQDKKIFWFVVLLILTLWSIFWFYAYKDVHIWYDEGITILQIAGHFQSIVTHTFLPGHDQKELLDGHANLLPLVMFLTKADVHPPLYYIIAEFWTRLVGGDVALVRLLSTVFVAASCAIFLCWKTEKKEARLSVLPLFLLSPTVVYAASNARGYGLALLLVCAAFYFIHKTMRNAKAGAPYGGDVFFAILFSCLAFLTHYFTALVLVPAMIQLLPQFARSGHRSIFYSSLFIFATLACSAFFLKYQFGARESQYAGFEGYFAETKGMLFYLTQQFTFNQTSSFFVLGSLALSLLSITTLARFYRNPHAQIHLLSLVGFCFLTLLLFSTTDKTIAGAMQRYFVFTLPSLVFGISLCLEKLSGRTWALSGLLTLGFTTGASTQGTNLEPWTRALNYTGFQEDIAQMQNLDGYVIIPASAWGQAPHISYLPDETLAIVSYFKEDLEKAFEHARDGEAMIIVPPAQADKEMIRFIQDEIEESEQCGFEKEGHGLWIKKTEEAC